jgi:small neutral amino acid transporter SnatA (MarC family)
MHDVVPSAVSAAVAAATNTRNTISQTFFFILVVVYLWVRVSPRVKARILRLGIEAGAVLVDIGQVAMSEDLSIGVRGLQLFQQFQQGRFCLGVRVSSALPCSSRPPS